MNATATTHATAPTTKRSNRVLAVFKLHFANPTTVLWMPLGILGLIFTMNWLLWLIIAAAAGEGDGVTEGTAWSGASMFIFVWLLVVAVQAMNRTFHFALGFGAARKDYYLGTVGALVLTSAGWSIVVATLAVIEESTKGWGLGGHMFASIYFGDDGPFARLWYIFLLMLFFMSLGLVAGAAFVRWKTLGLLAFFAVLGFALIGGIAWLALTDSWIAFGSFFATLGFAGAYPLLLIPVVVSSLIGYLALRRATARS